ncbi:beta-lactamase superfamily domain-domain-containing protein [Kockovaella imperatae]|uniref:Beta-lactamase superfamily domain-domain-containing protein n=1 Tax=Kockovaella imperatae TaxID=4999 RepID=A0A1Y1UGR1_9TREE|nr:beta-lactamase superfamily domain-domain-containing protein [Kockovaella imperatae]ORX36694.1 beta-lactamase superfamily domain-domain-containing protein [Kockovaella imperatae]
MDTSQHPRVALLSPSSSLSVDHHVASSKLALSTADSKPTYFQNPWRSYRAPSLNDAWLAYQKGAAIALPPHKTPARRPYLGTGPEDESAPLAVDPEADDADDPRDSSGALWSEGGWLGKVYVRPEFATVKDEVEREHWKDPPIEVIEPDWREYGDQSETGDVTWLGHASVLVRIPWKRDGEKQRAGACGVLFDPIFSYRCSPSQYVGPARYLPPPCTVADLPPIHICCISHDHYDHLDYYTIMDLWKYHQATIHFFVPMGLKGWFTASTIPEDRVTELDWYHETLLNFPYPSSGQDEGTVSDDDGDDEGPSYSAPAKVDPEAALTLKIAFTPAQHRSGRGILDHMTTLWGSWCIGVVDADDALKATDLGMKGWKGWRMFFGGDTGYRYATAPEDDEEAVCPAFQEIASLYSPFDFCMLPLSTGSSLPFLRTVLSLSLDQYTLTSSQHCSPGDALEIHRIMKSRRSLGIHWGTFCDADEARGTRITFARERRDGAVCNTWEGEGDGKAENGRFVISDIGQILTFPQK